MQPARQPASPIPRPELMPNQPLIHHGDRIFVAGHRGMAGAQIPMDGKSERSRLSIRRKIISELLNAYGEDSRHFHRIMTKNPSNEGRSSRSSRRPAKKSDKQNGSA